MASMKRTLDTVLKKYKSASIISMGALATMAVLEYETKLANYSKADALAKRMIRRCYKIKRGFAGGVVNPFYKPPRKRKSRSVVKRHADGAINVEATIAAYCGD